jgi:hypothetical protein
MKVNNGKLSFGIFMVVIINTIICNGTIQDVDTFFGFLFMMFLLLIGCKIIASSFENEKKVKK